jgi:hypothetical protein
MTGRALKELYTTTLKEGMYIVVVENEEHRVVEKVMVSH